MRRIITFAAVGAVNTGVYYGLYLLLRLVVPYLVAHVVAFVLAMVGSYFLNCRFTFRTKPSLRTFLLFPLSNATNFVITSVGLYLLVDLWHMNQQVSPLIAAAAAIPITYIVAKYILSEKQTGKQTEKQTVT
ncbi:GtrA family protein [Kibdelosporangium lantanae]|uniref:GtrA family protein n=1 Tax=Kibdelosporangium lantanae TaxID=1497396 RepID=A0ABW3M4Q6_9PSEU